MTNSRLIVGAEKTPDGTIDYSKAAIMEQPIRTFFGSEKAVHVKAMAEKMASEENPLAGYMLDEVIYLAIFEPELDRKGVEQKVLSKFNFDGATGKPIDAGVKQQALKSAMTYFDELQEVRDAVIKKGKELAHGSEDQAKTEKIETVEFQEYVQKILRHLDTLDELLDPAKFKPGWGPLPTHLNLNISGILAFRRVLSETSTEERQAMAQKADVIEEKMRRALDLCNAEKVKRERDMGGEYVTEETFKWLEKEGPAVMQSLRELS